MRFDGDAVGLTPPEAAYIEDICLFQPTGNTADKIKWKIKSGILRWAKAVLPHNFDAVRGEGSYAMLRDRAVTQWQPEEGEAIEVELGLDEIETIKQLAILAVTTAKEEGGTINDDFAINSILGDALFPGEIELSYLDNDEEETLKGQLFEEKLEEIAIGDSIIAAINNSQKSG